ncbi:MAG: fasciclin domain-containing protein [Vitreoscilla sp.]
MVDNAVNSKDHTTLVAAVKAAGLVDTLKSPGPFTVFAPTNEAFAALPAGTVDTLLKPENKAKLTSVLTYHVVAGKMDAAALMTAVKAGGGKATLKTVEGDPLTVMVSGGKVMVMDESGGTATVTIADVYQSNGVIHVVDKVLLPK